MERQSDIVVVDDEPDVREILSLTLEIAGYTVTTAKDGAEAIAMVADRRPRLVITDIHMPRMRGDELAEELARRFGTSSPPVIIITSHYTAANTLRLNADYRAVLNKPVDPAELIDLIDSILDPDGT